MTEPAPAASFVVFRALLGGLVALGAARFFAHGWIDAVYVEPRLHLHYWGFGWVRPLGAIGMRAVFAALGLTALLLAAGVRQRATAALCALLFTYVELCEKATYLNHYYLITLLLVLLAALPAPRGGTVPIWVYYLLRAQFGFVYFFAGVAKLDADWLLRGQPLATWLYASSDLPVLGRWLDDLRVARVASWLGLLLDLSAPLLLSLRRTRAVGLALVVVFHVVTGLLLPIGVFPWLMIAGATLFADPGWPGRLGWRSVGRMPAAEARVPRAAIALWLAVQVALPLRALAYPDPNWTEQGFRYSWRVMVADKVGSLDFTVRDATTARTWRVPASEYLTPLQARAVVQSPDMILELAHVIRDDYAARVGAAPAVYADSWVAFNGHPAARNVDPTRDLAAERDGLARADWILPRPR